jgi:hypothetical protein
MDDSRELSPNVTSSFFLINRSSSMTSIQYLSPYVLQVAFIITIVVAINPKPFIVIQ